MEDFKEENDKRGFWHGLSIFKKELSDIEKELNGEIEVTDSHLDAHIEELEEKANFLRSTYQRLFGE